MSKKTITISVDQGALLEMVPQLREVPPKQWQSRISRVVREILSRQQIEIDTGTQLPSGGARLRIGLSAAHAERFGALVKRYGMAQSDLMIRLLMQYGNQAEGADRALVNNPLAAPFLKKLKAHGYNYRPAQIETLLGLTQPMRKGKIALVEAGTGTGKSVAMLMAADDWAKRHGKRCLIAVPTLNIVRQMEREAEKLGIEVRAVVGRQQFVSEHRAEDLALKLDKTQRAQIRWWIDNRAQAANWSLDDFLTHVDVKGDWVSLESVSDASDRGFLAWKAQFGREATHDGEVIICTHTMLALDFMLRQREGRRDEEVIDLLDKAFGKDHDGFFEYVNAAGRRIAVITEESGKLPAWAALIVDEAHLLERAFSAVMGDSVSLVRLKWGLASLKDKVEGIKARHLKQVDTLIDTLRNLPGTDGVSTFALGDASMEWGVTAKRLVKIKIETPEEKLKQLDPQDLIKLVTVQESLARLKAVLSARMRWVSFSQKRKFPSLHAGAPNVGAHLALMWGGVQAAGLVSATLFVPTKTRGYSSNHMIRLLSLERDRVEELRVMPPDWLKASITQVSCSDAVMPAGEGPEDFDRWIEELSPKLEKIIASAAGGVLILSNALDVTYALTERIGAINVSPLFHPTLGQQREHAMKLARAGERIVWIGVGAAWTGLDFSGAQLGISAEQDNTLTDLVILRAPFGQNHTITHLWRKARQPNYPWEMYEGYFTFKQGLGRLIRREGLPGNRRIWVLDRRICEPKGNQFFVMLNTALRSLR